MIYSQLPKNVPKVTIRPLDANDEPEIISLIETVLNEHRLKIDPIYDSDLQNLYEYYSGVDDHFLVAICNDKIAGCCAVKNIGPSEGELRKLYVLNRFRNLGLGSLLLDSILIFCKDHHYHKLALTTDERFIKAVTLYQSRGFNIINKLDSDIFMEKL